MPTDLRVPVLCRRTLRKIHPLENGVLPKFLFDSEHGLLYFLFPCQLFVFLLALRVERSIIGEEVKLLIIALGRRGGGFVKRNIGNTRERTWVTVF